MACDPFALPATLLAVLTGVQIETARRWKARGHIPRPYQSLIELHTSGDLGVIAKAWTGFRIVDGKIWTPEDGAVTPGDVRAIPYRAQLLKELERQLSEPQQWKLL